MCHADLRLMVPVGSTGGMIGDPRYVLVESASTNLTQSEARPKPRRNEYGGSSKAAFQTAVGAECTSHQSCDARRSAETVP